MCFHDRMLVLRSLVQIAQSEVSSTLGSVDPGSFLCRSYHRLQKRKLQLACVAFCMEKGKDKSLIVTIRDVMAQVEQLACLW